MGQQPVVPGGDLGQPIVGDHESAGLRRGKVIEAQRRYLGNSNFATGQHSAMAGDYVVVTIDQDRNNEVEGFQAVANLPDLFFAVAARVCGVRFQLVYPAINAR